MTACVRDKQTVAPAKRRIICVNRSMMTSNSRGRWWEQERERCRENRQNAPFRYELWFEEKQNEKQKPSFNQCHLSRRDENQSSSEHWTRKKYIWNGIFVFMEISLFGFCFIHRSLLLVLQSGVGSEYTRQYKHRASIPAVSHSHALSIIYIILLFRAVWKVSRQRRLLLTRAWSDNINRIKQPEQIYLTFLDSVFVFFFRLYLCHKQMPTKAGNQVFSHRVGTSVDRMINFTKWTRMSANGKIRTK